MANITPEPNYIQIEETRFRAPVSEATLTRMGASINFLLDKIPFNVQKIEFLSNTTWVAPQNAIFGIVEGVGGGGGGAGGKIGDNYAGSGGFSGRYAKRFFMVAPNSSYTIQIGQGGQGGVGAAGQQGQNSLFVGPGANFIFWGGGGGKIVLEFADLIYHWGGYENALPGSGGRRYLNVNQPEQNGFAGVNFFEFPGGAGGAKFLSMGGGGGGGAGPFGPGGNGGNGGFNGQSAAPNSGAGGGGAGSYYTFNTAVGNGGSGRIVLWLFTKE
jgi:hypothetical protein